MAAAGEQARHAQSSSRSASSTPTPTASTGCSLQRWLGRREDLPETVGVIGSLVSDRAAAW